MKKATLKDVALAAGVSKATVSYVLNNSQKTISEETKQKVYSAVEKLNYVPDLSAKSLNSRSSHLIGVVVPQTEPGSRLMFQNSFYSEVLGSIEYHARQKGYHIIISATDVNENYMKLVMERNLDGVIVIGMYPTDFYEQFKKIEVPVVLIDSYCKDNYFHNVRIDDKYGSYLSTEYAIKAGHKEIAIFSGMLHENGVMQKRIEGYKNALKDYGLSYKKEYIFEGNVDYESGVASAGRLAESKLPVTAVVATADILAIGAMKGLTDKGLRIPEDVSVIGFDDLEISKYLIPGLTTVKQQISLKGEKAVELIDKSILIPEFESQEVILPFEILERESVKQMR